MPGGFCLHGLEHRLSGKAGQSTDKRIYVAYCSSISQHSRSRAAAGSFSFPSHLIELCFKVFCLTNVRSALTWPLGLSFWFSIGIYNGRLWERPLHGGGLEGEGQGLRNGCGGPQGTHGGRAGWQSGTLPGQSGKGWIPPALGVCAPASLGQGLVQVWVLWWGPFAVT